MASRSARRPKTYAELPLASIHMSDREVDLAVSLRGHDVVLHIPGAAPIHLTQPQAYALGLHLQAGAIDLLQSRMACTGPPPAPRGTRPPATARKAQPRTDAAIAPPEAGCTDWICPERPEGCRT